MLVPACMSSPSPLSPRPLAMYIVPVSLSLSPPRANPQQAKVDLASSPADRRGILSSLSVSIPYLLSVLCIHIRLVYMYGSTETAKLDPVSPPVHPFTTVHVHYILRTAPLPPNTCVPAARIRIPVPFFPPSLLGRGRPPIASPTPIPSPLAALKTYTLLVDASVSELTQPGKGFRRQEPRTQKPRNIPPPRFPQEPHHHHHHHHQQQRRRPH
ncbi:uncharacterized protein LY79DRAFT_54068 [Colletotrichum navitas]|uniref:Uncharacterized protein n=1 Tax=Colletotrichum navitas TaxID=681940 RepID=A0AAD8PMQ9_9PEZI|nr:uncharacterized protein LY79DRAFT_54068 [Colletotrichum navitas]KAK1570102.1 hypothetical protein LY79DRAFT_54068 [Colletotrichum navitas]